MHCRVGACLDLRMGVVSLVTAAVRHVEDTQAPLERLPLVLRASVLLSASMYLYQ